MKNSWKLESQKKLLALGAPHVVTTQDLEAFGRFSTDTHKTSGPSSASLTRWLRTLTESGALQPVARGVYLNRLAGPSIHPAEAAQFIRRHAIVSLAWVLEQSGALNNFGDTVTCVIPQIPGMAPPKVGERETRAAPFRFYAMPARLIDAGSNHIDDVQDLRYAYPRATPERALLDWIYLGTSVRSRLPLPPLDISLHSMRIARIARVAKAMGIDAQWKQWYAAWKALQASADVEENASTGLGF